MSSHSRMSTSSIVQSMSAWRYEAGLAAVACLSLQLVGCTYVLTDRDWNPRARLSECEVREVYTGPEGLIEHNRNILEARTKLFQDYADNHFMTFYGETSPPLLDLLKAHQVAFKWFSFLKGLEPSVKI